MAKAQKVYFALSKKLRGVPNTLPPVVQPMPW